MPKKYILQRMNEKEDISLRVRWNRLKLRFATYDVGKVMVFAGLSENYKTANCITTEQMQGFCGVSPAEGVHEGEDSGND